METNSIWAGFHPREHVPPLQNPRLKVGQYIATDTPGADRWKNIEPADAVPGNAAPTDSVCLAHCNDDLARLNTVCEKLG